MGDSDDQLRETLLAIVERYPQRRTMLPHIRRARELLNADQPSTQSEKHRASYLTVSQQYDLNLVCRPLASIGYGTFHVGSSLTQPDFHDVDLRCILPDDQYDQMFESDSGEAFLKFLNIAISEWVAARTSLPIDFQFQRATQANETFKGRRNGVGH